MSHLGIFKLEDRVLFDAAGAAEVVEAASNVDNHSQVSESQVQDNEAKDALKNAPPENPADAAVQQQVQQATPENVADLDAAADAIVDGEIVPGDNPVDADAADAADADDHAAPAVEAHADAADADDISADDDGGDVQAADTADGIDAIQHADLGDDIDDFINLDQDAEQDSDGDSPVALDGGAVAADADAPQRDLVIINSSVQNKEQIVEALGENTDVLYLEAGTDPLDAINDFLDANGDVKYSAIHIVSHGNAGYFVLNGQIIDADAVMSDPASWANIGQHMTADGDIMIYGCNVAGSLDGEMLISNIANLTGADVAASVDDTGARGDWDLEYTVGTIDNPFLDASDYDYTLSNWEVTKETGTDEGSLAWAFGVAHGGDEILLSVDASTEGIISFTGNLTLSSNGGAHTATITSGAWNASGSTNYLTIDSDTTLVISSQSTFSGNLNVSSGGTLNVSGTVSGPYLINSGTIQISNVNANLSGAQLINYGTVNATGGQWGSIANNGTFNISESSVTWTDFQNYDTLKINTSFSNISSSNFTNNGDLEISSGGSLSLSSEMTIGGTVTVDKGGLLSISATGSATDNTSHTGGVEFTNLINDGNVYISSGALLAVSHQLTNTNLIQVMEGSTLSLADSVSSTVGGTVYVYGGSLYCADSLLFNDVERWYKVDADTTLSGFITANGLVYSDNINFYMTDGAVLTLDTMYENTAYSYEVIDGGLVVQVASVIGSLESYGSVTVSADLEITGTTIGSGTMNSASNAAVIYRQSGTVFGGTYGSDLSLTGTSMSINGDVVVAGVFSAKTTTGSVSVSISNGASLTIQGVVADALTTKYNIYGAMNIETQAAKVAVAGAMYVGTRGSLNLAGDYVSLNGYVAIQSGYGTVNVTGDYTEFTAGFSDAGSWYNYSGYTTSIDASGLHESDQEYQQTSTISSYNGSLTINTTGEVVFSGSHEVVIANELNIEQAAKVTFNATVVMAAGTFTASENVSELYFNDVYLSTQYRTPRETNFNIAAKDTVFGGSLNLYAVSPRNYTNDGTNQDGSFKWNHYTDYTTGVNSSGSNAVVLMSASRNEKVLAHFTGERVAFNDSVSLSSAFGAVTFTNEAGAMTFNGNITNDASGRQPADGGAAALITSGKDKTVGYMTDYSKFFLGDNSTVNGTVTNTATNISLYTLQTPYAYFSIGSNNNFSASSSFVNSGSYLFVAVEVQGGGNNFSGSFTNSASLSVNPGPDAARNVFENLVNKGSGEVTFAQSGNASVNINNQAKLTVTDTSDGIQFTGLTNSGTASILADVKFLEADFGSGAVSNTGTLTINGTLESELSLSNTGTATIAGPDSVIKGDITNSGTFNFRSNAEVTGVVNNSGTLNVDAGASGMVFATLLNAASGTVQLNAQATLNNVTNSGSLTVNTTASTTVIGALDNKSGAKLIASGAVVFGLGGGEGGVENAGTITISNSVSCIDGAELVNYAGGYLYLNQTLPLDDHSNTLNISNAGTIEISGTVHLGDVTNSAGATLRLTTAASVICFDGTLVNDSGITGTGSVVFRGSMSGSGYLALAGADSSVTYDASSDDVSQIFYATDASGNYVYNADVVILGGEVHINRDITFNRGFSLGQQDSSGAVEGDGTLVVDSGYTFNASTVDLYSGTLQIQNGAVFQSSNDLVFSSNIALLNNGVIQLLDGKSVTFGGGTAGTGTLAMSGGNITYSGTVDQYLYATSGAFGAMTLAGGMKYVGFDMTMSNLTNNGADMTVQNGVTLTLGQVTGSDTSYTIYVEQGAALKAGSESTALGSIDNSGLVQFDVAAGKTVTTGAISNNAGGEVALTSNGSLTVGGAVTNAGTMNVAGSVGFADAVTNSSVLNLNSGAITVSGLLTNTGTVNASAGTLTSVENNAAFNVNASSVVLGAFTNNGALNFNTDFNIGDATFGSPADTVTLGGDVFVAAGKTLTVSMAHQLRFADTLNVAENATFEVYSVGTYDQDAVALLTGGVYVANLENAGEVLVRGLTTSAEAVLEVNNVVTNSGRISALAQGVLLLSQTASDVPGEVYAQDGKVFYAGNVPLLSIWLTITGEEDVSSFVALYPDLYTGNYGFLVKDGGTLTVDSTEAGNSDLKYNVEEGGALIFAVTSNVAGAVNVAEGGSIGVASGAAVTFLGVTSGNGTMNAAGSVVYDNTGAGFGGSYEAGLTVNGDGITFGSEVTASELSVAGTGVTFANGVTSNSTIAVTGENATFGGAVNAADAVEISGGNATLNGAVTAGSLNVAGSDATFNGSVVADDVAVSGSAVFNSTMNASGTVSGTGNVTFNGAATAAGGAAMGAGSQVTYNAGSAQVIDGSYDSLTLNGAHTMNNATVNGTAAINGSVTSSGTLNFGASGNVVAGADGAINSTGQVVYAGSGDVVSGSYNQLTISGSDQTAGDVTVNGSLQYTGSGLDVNGVFTNNGTVELDGNPANFNNTVVNNGAFDVAGNANQFTGDFVNNKTLEVSGDDNVFFRVTNNGEFTLSGDHNFFSAVSNQRNFAITGDANRIVSFTNTAITNINGSDNSFGSINNTGNGIIYKDGQMWMVSGVGGVGDGFPDEYNLNFSSLAMLLGNELRAAELQELFLAGDDSPFVFRRRISRIPDGIDDLALALESEFDELQLETLDDVTAFDAADFQDGDYADVMDSADVFTDTVDEAIAEMAAV